MSGLLRKGALAGAATLALLCGGAALAQNEAVGPMHPPPPDSQINGVTVDNRGVWRIHVTRNNGRILHTALINVRDANNAAAHLIVRKFVAGGETNVDGPHAMTCAPSFFSPQILLRAVRLCAISPTSATVSPSSRPRCSRIVIISSKPCVGCSCHPSPALTTGISK